MTNNEMLDMLDAERRKFTRADSTVMQELIDKLVASGEYPRPAPTMKKYGYSYLKMVEGYGAWWHVWTGPLVCAVCGADWRDHGSGPPFKRAIAISSGDSTRSFECPDCHSQQVVSR